MPVIPDYLIFTCQWNAKASIRPCLRLWYYILARLLRKHRGKLWEWLLRSFQHQDRWRIRFSSRLQSYHQDIQLTRSLLNKIVPFKGARPFFRHILKPSTSYNIFLDFSNRAVLSICLHVPFLDFDQLKNDTGVSLRVWACAESSRNNNRLSENCYCCSPRPSLDNGWQNLI